MKRVNDSKIKSLLAAFVFMLMLTPASANADFIFGRATSVGPTVNSSARDEEPGISADGLSLYYCSNRPGGYGNYDLWVTRRATTEDDWGPPVNLGSTVNSSSNDFSPDISADGLSLYFGSDRPGGYGSYDIWVTRRATTEDDWGTPVNLGPMVNSSAGEGCQAISDDGLELYFWSGRPGGYGSADIWVARRATIEDDWGMPVNLGPTINGSATELCSDITADGLCLVFVSTRSGGYGGTYGDIWITTRPTISDPWGPPVNPGPIVNSSTTDNGPFLSADGSILYFSSERLGGSGDADMWQVSITTIVDFNGDEIVDLKDFSKLAQYWGQNESSVDIGPTPFGDRTVDVRDVAVLTDYWLTEVLPTDLIAYWKLDETEGTIAHDSIGDNHGTLNGNPVWQPASGKINGALQFDGIDDYVSTPFILDPAAGPFSVFAWVKGGGPEQAIVSQAGGVNWLAAGTSQGKLMTELKAPGRFGTPLFSEAVIIDGEWHRVGLTWDGSTRTLFVDNVEVAKGTQGTLAGSQGGLYIGAGKGLEPGGFWSGLIDDVRIYDRAIKP